MLEAIAGRDKVLIIHMNRVLFSPYSVLSSSPGHLLCTITNLSGRQVSYIIVDEMHEDHPELVRDQYWEDVIPADLPYTVAAEQYRRDPPQGSAAQIDVSQTGQR